MEQGLRLEELMNKKDCSNVQLASLLGVSKELISYYRTGKRTPPLSSMVKLAEALEINFIELFITPDGYFHYYDEVTGEWGGIWKKNSK